MKNSIILYIIIINLIAFSAMGIDKSKAKRKKWRIPEKTLMMFAIIGGSVGMILGMNIFRHKTKHKLFSLGGPFIFVCQIVAVVYFIFR